MTELELVSPRVAAITSGWSGGNVGGISLENSVIAIDTTHNFTKGKIFREQLEATFEQPVRHVFLTHHHSDHAKGMDAFSDAEIISSKGTARKVRALGSVRTYPTTHIDQEYRIQEGELQVIMVPVGGHTSDSSYLVFPHDNIIFAGDLIFENYLLFAGYQSDPLIWLKVLKTFRELKPNRIIPGHGPVLETPHDLNKHISLLQSFIETIRKARSTKIPPKEIKVPEFIYQFSKKVPPSELEKWFYRTLISWYKRI